MEDMVLNDIAKEISMKYNKKEEIIKIILLRNMQIGHTYEESKYVLEKILIRSMQ